MSRRADRRSPRDSARGSKSESLEISESARGEVGYWLVQLPCCWICRLVVVGVARISFEGAGGGRGDFLPLRHTM